MDVGTFYSKVAYLATTPTVLVVGTVSPGVAIPSTSIAIQGGPTGSLGAITFEVAYGPTTITPEWFSSGLVVIYGG